MAEHKLKEQATTMMSPLSPRSEGDILNHLLKARCVLSRGGLKQQPVIKDLVCHLTVGTPASFIKSFLQPDGMTPEEAGKMLLLVDQRIKAMSNSGGNARLVAKIHNHQQEQKWQPHMMVARKTKTPAKAQRPDIDWDSDEGKGACYDRRVTCPRIVRREEHKSVWKSRHRVPRRY